MRIKSWSLPLAFLLVALAATDVTAQTVGTFRWQYAPYCNTVTLLVEHKAGSYVLTGTDDQCGAAIRAAATGSAHLNPNGTVSLGITVVRPDGIPVVHSVLLDLPTLSGSWSANYGNSGLFLFNPTIPVPGPPRPVTIRGNFDVDFNGANRATGSSAISFGLTLPVPPIPHLVWDPDSITECPGTAANPQAAPGHLCVYRGDSSSLFYACVASTSGGVICDRADRTGAAVALVQGLAPGRVFIVGTWAVTVP